MNRRDFLKQGMVVAGTVAAAGGVVKALDKGVGEPNASKAGAGCCVTPALTPEGNVIHVCGDKVVKGPVPAPPDKTAVRRGVPGRKWVMAIDLAKCDGCKKCTDACTKMHFIPPDREWIKVFKMLDSPKAAPYWFPKPCFHCDNPPCTRVCPVDATFKRQDGVVLIDNERCIGCRFCMAACPYSTRYFNWQRPTNSPENSAVPYSPERGYPRRVGTVEKCDFCPDMAAQGMLPGCVAACGKAAMYFGDQNEDAVTNSIGETERLSKLLADRAGYRFLEELGTEPRVYYLPPKNRIFPVPGT
jgi:Fe-S-cluster-containing dehydrogenase component